MSFTIYFLPYNKFFRSLNYDFDYGVRVKVFPNKEQIINCPSHKYFNIVRKAIHDLWTQQ